MKLINCLKSIYKYITAKHEPIFTVQVNGKTLICSKIKKAAVDFFNKKIFDIWDDASKELVTLLQDGRIIDGKQKQRIPNYCYENNLQKFVRGFQGILDESGPLTLRDMDVDVQKRPIILYNVD